MQMVRVTNKTEKIDSNLTEFYNMSLSHKIRPVTCRSESRLQSYIKDKEWCFGYGTW